MSILVRRSNLMVPVTNPRFVEGAWRHNADAVTLDLEDGVPDTLTAFLRGSQAGSQRRHRASE